jgi:tetraacyldisaccharide 4'-kinase
MLFHRQYRSLVSGRLSGPAAGTLRAVLGLLEHPYEWIIDRRNSRFDRGSVQPHKVAATVISVGNLTVGGTGKSPFVAWLARWFIARGQAVAIISRGYGAGGGRPNDEALELAARLPRVPHIQHPDRIAAAEAALAANPTQVLILDDAFQHRRLARDLDIVLLDALEPFGHGHLLPRGLLREPVASLARAHIVALSRSDAIDEPRRRQIEAEVRRHAPGAQWIELVHEPARLVAADGRSMAIDGLCGQRIAAFCGIGNPAGFRHTLQRCGLEIAGWFELPDHCAYQARHLDQLQQWLASLDVQQVICTRKDLVKIPRDELNGKPLWALDVELEIVRGQAELEALLQQIAPRT